MLNYQRASSCVVAFFLSLSLSLCLNVLRYTHQKKTRTFPNMNPEMLKTGRHKIPHPHHAVRLAQTTSAGQAPPRESFQRQGCVDRAIWLIARGNHTV